MKLSNRFMLCSIFFCSFLYSGYFLIDLVYITLSSFLFIYLISVKVKAKPLFLIFSLNILLFYLILQIALYSFHGISPFINLWLSVGTYIVGQNIINSSEFTLLDNSKEKEASFIFVFGLLIIYIGFDVFINIMSLIENGDYLRVILDPYAHYEYKKSSTLSDTNSLALMLICLYVVLDCVRLRRAKALSFLKLVALALILLSFSKSAITALILYRVFSIFGIIRFFQAHPLIMLTGYVLGFVGVSLIYSVFAGLSILGDSFISKIYIFELLTEYLGTADFMTIVFGSGLQESLVVFGMYSHVYLATVFVEAGIVGVFLNLAFLSFVALRTPNGFALVFMPLLIASMSYYPLHGMPWIFASVVMAEKIIKSTKSNEAKLV